MLPAKRQGETAMPSKVLLVNAAAETIQDVRDMTPPGCDLVVAAPGSPGFAAALAETEYLLGNMDNMDDAFRDADVVIPKSWGCLDTMGAAPAESLRIARQHQDWRCDAARMKLARAGALYMHPLPADRGNEVTDDVIDGPQSVVYDEAENRLHTAKAIMALTMADAEIEYEPGDWGA